MQRALQQYNDLPSGLTLLTSRALGCHSWEKMQYHSFTSTLK